MAHCLIVGRSKMGKSTLGKRIAAKLKAQGVEVYLLSPMKDHQNWSAVQCTDDPVLFKKWIMETKKKAAFFVDEAHEYCTASTFGLILKAVAVMGRHWGNRIYFMSQRAVDVLPGIRSQCSDLFCFNQTDEDVKALSKNFVADLSSAPSLGKGECFVKLEDQELCKINIFENKMLEVA